MAEKKKDPIKDPVPIKDEKENLLMTQEEFDRRQRLAIKENINRVLRIAGLVGILFLVSVGIIPLFQLSVFGLIFTKEIYHSSWDTIMSNNEWLRMMMGNEWLVVVLLTIILFAIILGVVYLVTYNIVDLIVFFKNIGKGFKNATEDLRGTVKDTMTDDLIVEKKPIKKEKKEEKKEKEKAKKEVVKQQPESGRRSEKEVDDLTGLSSEQLDALLRGESIDGSIPEAEEGEKESEKDLFKEDKDE